MAKPKITTESITSSSLIHDVVTSPFHYSLDQILRIFKALYPKTLPYKGPDLLWEMVDIKTKISLANPSSEVDAIKIHEKKPVVVVNFASIAGVQGSLPTPYNELLMDRLRHHDSSFADFLDILPNLARLNVNISLILFEWFVDLLLTTLTLISLLN